MLKRNDNYRSTRNCYIGGNNIKYIVVHYTGYFAPCINYCLSQMNNDLNGSAHDFVSDDEWYNAIEHSNRAWAVGDDQGYGVYPNGIRNDNSLSIEMCCCNANLDVSEKTMKNTAEIVAYYMKVYNVPIGNVKRHYDASYKECPRDMTPYVKDGESRWGVFLSWVKAAYNGVAITNNTTAKPKEVDNKGEDQMFSSNWYLNRYKDVAASKTYKDNPYKHYIEYGKKEGRQPLPPVPANYCEADYLELNPDVAAAVKKGAYVSGIHHYMMYGWCEDRKINKKESDAELKARIKELENKISKVKEVVK